MSYLGQQLGQGQAERFVFTASGGETSVTTSDDGRAIAYTVGQVDVYLNGAKLINGSDFTATTGTSITGLAALTASDVVEVFALSIFQASDTVSAASGGTFNGNVTVDANLSVTGTVDIDTSLNVDGTVTADGLTVSNTTALIDITATTADTLDRGVTLSFGGSVYGKFATNYNTGQTVLESGRSGTVGYFLDFNTDGKLRQKIANNGDISFYEDTGTTPKFFWDASAEWLSIGGTTGTFAPINFIGSNGRLGINNGNTSGGTKIQSFATTNANGYLAFEGWDREYMRIDSNGNVGIGTDSPARQLHVKNGSSYGYARVEGASGGYGGVLEFVSNSVGSGTDFAGVLDFYMTTSNHIGRIRVQRQSGAANSGDMLFYTANAGSIYERARIDSSGNLLVGKTSSALGTAGVELAQGGTAGKVWMTRSGDNPLLINRLSTDGSLVDFYKDGTTIGSIGTLSGNASFGSGDVHLNFNATGNIIEPMSSVGGGASDGAIDIGQSLRRFKDLYLSGGVYLGGTGAANLLDDYEEGTWTPVVQGSGGGSYTHSGVTSRYTKVGNLVTITAQLINITTSGAGHSGYLTITGAPFTKIADTFPVGSVGLSDCDFAVGTTYGTVEFITTSATTQLYVRLHGDNVSGADLQTGDINSGTSDITFSIQYIAS